MHNFSQLQEPTPDTKDALADGVLPRKERQALRECLQLLEIDKKRFTLATLFGAGAIGSGVGLGSVSAWLIARAAQLPPVLDLSVAATAVRAFGVGKAIFRYLERISSHWVALQGMAAIRTRVYERLANTSIDTVTSIRRGDLLARTGADVDELGDVVVKSLLPSAVAIVTSLISIAIVAALSPLIGLILALCLFVSGVISPYFAMRGARLAEVQQVQDRAELNVQALTLLENAEELRVSGKLPAMEAAQAETETRIWKNRDRAAVPTAFASTIDLLALGVSVICALVIGSWQVAAGLLSPVNLVVVTLTPLAAFESTQRLSGAGVQLVRSARAALRIIEMVDRPQLNLQAANSDYHGRLADKDFSRSDEMPSDVVATDKVLAGAALTEITSTEQKAAAEKLALVANDLTIGWPSGPDIAQGLNLKLTPGKTIAIVGPSGIGKSTLLYTLAGMIKPHSGSVMLNGAPVSEIERKQLSQHLILTAEDAHIFETSVLENLRVVRADVTPEEAKILLQRAGLGSWLAQLPDSVDTMLGADAATISGGERRRLLLARALASPADFLLLDEPGEHLDPATADQLIRDLLAAGKTESDYAGLGNHLHASDVLNVHGTANLVNSPNNTGRTAANLPHNTENFSRKRGIILVTHRLNPLDAADEVIMLGGMPTQIIARGTHAELIATNAVYRWSLEQESQDFQEP